MPKALIHSPYWDSMGGGERYTISFIKLLLNRGWDVDVVWDKDISKELFDRFHIDISKAKFVSKHVYTSKYHLAFYVSDGSLPLSFARKTIIHFQFPFTNIPKLNLLDIFKTKIYTFVCNSQFTKYFIDKSFSVNSTIIYPPVDTDKFKSGKKTNTILYVGRFSQLTQLKNQELLIDSFSSIKSKIKGWKLVLAGGVGIGSEEKYFKHLQAKAKKSGVTIISNPSFSDLQKLFSEAKIFWSASGFGASELHEPTKVEHFGMSLVEAMSAGCVPIISNLGGHKEIVRNSINGFLVSDLDELGSRTLEIIKKPGLLSEISQKSQESSKLFDIRLFNSNYVYTINK